MSKIYIWHAFFGVVLMGIITPLNRLRRKANIIYGFNISDIIGNFRSSLNFLYSSFVCQD